MNVETYILTHNSPLRLLTCLERLRAADTRFFNTPVIVVDQSTNDSLAEKTAAVAAASNVEYKRFDNLGASGGRWRCAQLFHASNANAMFYFEDDLVFHNGAGILRSRFKLPWCIPNIYGITIEAVRSFKLGYLKLSFQEFYCDHSDETAHSGVRAKYALEESHGAMLFVGDAFYSNWPMLITKEASLQIFEHAPGSEGAYVQRAKQLRADGAFKAGVFAAETIMHAFIQDHRENKVDLIAPKIDKPVPAPVALGAIDYCGLSAQQHPQALPLFRSFFAAHKDIDLVLEIGAGNGGFAAFLKDEADKIGAKFVTYETDPARLALYAHAEFVRRNIDVRVIDALSAAGKQSILAELANSKRALILCDGGNKIVEFNTFAPHVRPGDIMMAHDYAPNAAVFQTEYVHKIWNWLEIDDESTIAARDAANLVPYHIEFNSAAWLCVVKQS